MNVLKAFVLAASLFVILGVIAATVSRDYAGPIVWLGGAGLLYALTARDGYRYDASSWVLLFLGPIGWFMLLWRRWNRLEVQSAQNIDRRMRT